MTRNAQNNKRKNRYIELQKIKNFCTSKDKIKQVKRLPTEWEKALANNISDKGLVAGICKKLLQLNNENTNKQSN